MLGMRLTGLATVVGILAFVEFSSGIIQGYYTPLFTDIVRALNIHDADVNCFEGGQLTVSALVIPLVAKLGDHVGHRRMLLVSAAIVAVVGDRLRRPRCSPLRATHSAEGGLTLPTH